MTHAIGTVPPARPMPTTGRWGWYQDHEGQAFRRVSTLVKEVETDNHNLDLWKQRQVLIGAARRGDLVTAVKAMGDPGPMTGWTREQKDLLNELAEKAAEAAKNSDGAITGTAMHTMTERIDRGEPIDNVLAAELPAAVAQGLRAYAHLRELNGWQSVEIERTVVCDELEVAGTFDRVDLVPGLADLLGPGECQHEHGVDSHFGAAGPVALDELPVIVDVKTENDPTRNGLHIGPQLAIYSRARRMWRATGGTHDLCRAGVIVTYRNGDPVQVPNGEYVAAPCVRQDVAIVVHIHDGDAAPLFVNLIEGWDAARAAHEQINRKARAKRRLGAAGAWFAPVPAKRPNRVETFVETQAARNLADPYRPGPGLAGMTPATPVTMAIPVVPGEQVAVRDAASGLVSWLPAARTATDTAGIAATVSASEAAADVVRGQLIEAIWKARTVDALAILWKMAQDRGVKWIGPIAMAGDARRRQIECVQRGLHTETLPKGSTKCACGWIAGQIA